MRTGLQLDGQFWRELERGKRPAPGEPHRRPARRPRRNRRRRAVLDPVQTVEYAAPWWRVTAYTFAGLAGVLVGALGLGLDDNAGRLLIAVVGAGAICLAGQDLVLRPTLRADALGIDVVDGLTRRRVPWSEVRSVGSVAISRRALIHLRTVELDLGERLVVLSRRQLGHDPIDVADRLEELRLRSARPS